MKRPSLRVLILIPTLLTMTAAFGAFAVYVDGVERTNRIADVDEELVRAAQTGTERTGAPPGNGDALDVAEAPSGDDDVAGVDPPVQLVVRDGEIIGQAGGDNPFSVATVLSLSEREGVRTIEDPRYRVRVIRSEDGTVSITALSLATIDAARSDFRRALVGGGLLILAAAGLVIWLVTRMLVRPLAAMAASSTLVAEGDLDAKIDPPRGGRETATLAADLERMVNRLRATITDREVAAEEATEARDAMQRFLADVSHELRTPLTALKGYSDLYAGHMLDEPGALERAMERVGDESDRLARLVADMLQLARQDLPSADRGAVDVCHVAEAVIDDLRAANPEHRIELRVDDEADAVVTANAGQVHQALLNLGSNACHHAGPDASVEFEIEPAGTVLLVRVVDHGSGVDPAERTRIFQPFYRPDDSRSRHRQGGAGLGLAVVERIATQHGGDVSVSTTPGGGATFTLTLPRSLQPVEPPPSLEVS
ncbi:MAG: hypothetical protein DHS20C19_18600 [Acidimicrobiales bacterium]|nr:MAG: hypothetical protein DHS20C19_18600 [Acidimicrobiales bacterium]